MHADLAFFHCVLLVFPTFFYLLLTFFLSLGGNISHFCRIPIQEFLFSMLHSPHPQHLSLWNQYELVKWVIFGLTGSTITQPIQLNVLTESTHLIKQVKTFSLNSLNFGYGSSRFVRSDQLLSVVVGGMGRVRERKRECVSQLVTHSQYLQSLTQTTHNSRAFNSYVLHY